MITLFNDDFFKIGPTLLEGSVSMIFADIPYNVTRCKWDKDKWDLEAMWDRFHKLLKPNGVVVMTATEPFNVDLINSNRKEFKYSWVWKKTVGSNFLNAKKQPLKVHELILVFYQKPPVYNPEMTPGNPVKWKNHTPGITGRECYGKTQTPGYSEKTAVRYPISVQSFPVVNNAIGKAEGRIRHPTEKPVELLEYMIKTYTNPGDMVLDPCMGTGVTMLACQNLGRRGLGLEIDREYFETAQKRLGRTTAKEKLGG